MNIIEKLNFWFIICAQRYKFVSVMTPRLWNSLPVTLKHNPTDVESFKTATKITRSMNLQV